MAALKLSRQKAQGAPGVLVVRIGGEIDGVTGHQAETYFSESLEAEHPKHVLLDLRDLTFADSTFFSSLLFWQEEMNKRSGSLVIFGMRPMIANTLRLLTLDRALPVHTDEATALASLPKE